MLRVAVVSAWVLAATAMLSPLTSVAQVRPVSTLAQLARAGLMNGCMASLTHRVPLAAELVGSSFLVFEPASDHPAFPVAEVPLSVWKTRSASDRIFVYSPINDSSECYISVYGGDFSEISSTLGQVLGAQDSPFEMKGRERVPNTNSMMVRYDSTRPDFPAVITIIMNAFADDSTPTVQVAVKRINGTS